MTSPLRIGLTGGIASGKSAAATAFAALGVPVLDTDVIAREVVEPGQPGLARIVAEFGERVLDGDGKLDRGALRALVFADPAARRQLEAMLHPAIWARLERQSATAGGPYQVFVIPLLIESNAADAVDRVLVVDCAVETQMRRLRERDGEGEAGSRAMLAAQASREQRLAAADDVLNNDGTLQDLQDRVEALDRSYRAMAAARN